MALKNGDIVAGKYEITDVLGEGGMGTVYDAIYRKLHRRVAIKVLKPGLADDDAIVRRFEREAQAAGRIGSEHIVDVHDVGELESGVRYQILEYLSGESLSTRLKRIKRLSTEQAFSIAVQVLDGLGAAHDAGIVHRDLKPANIFLVDDRKAHEDFVKILDFGVSKFQSISEGEGVTQTGTIVGTPHYMAPEQTKGARNADARSDIYAVGALLYRMLAGRPPYRGETIHELLVQLITEDPPPLSKVAPGIEDDVELIVHGALARDPDDRYQTCMELGLALRRWLSEHGYDDVSVEGSKRSLRGRRAMQSLPDTTGPFRSVPGDESETIPTGPSTIGVVSSVKTSTINTMNSPVSQTAYRHMKRQSRIAYVVAGLGLLLALAITLPVAFSTSSGDVESTPAALGDAPTEPSAEVAPLETASTAEDLAPPPASATASAKTEPKPVAKPKSTGTLPTGRVPPKRPKAPMSDFPTGKAKPQPKPKPKPGRVMRTDLD